VTDELDHQIRLALRRRRRSPIVPIALVVFAISVACACLWANYGDELRTVFAMPPAIGLAEASGEQPVSRADFDTFQRQTTDSLQSTAENLEAQKADLKRLSDQVADLGAKVDALRSAPATAPASPPIRNSIPAQPVIPPRSAAIAQRRKPQVPKPTGPISVGGAPLPPDQ
jgi:hypothetical protein